MPVWMQVLASSTASPGAQGSGVQCLWVVGSSELVPGLWVWWDGQLGRVRGAEVGAAAAGEFPEQLPSTSFFIFSF